MAESTTELFHPLDNTIQRYDWGSTVAIQDLLGAPVDGRPAAELWLGAHPLAPSRLAAPGLAAPGDGAPGLAAPGGGAPGDGAGGAPRPAAPGDGAGAGRARTLADLIRADPAAALGRRVLDEYGPRLPYLFKVLAAERALSLQVHPMPHLARAGFNRENRAGIPFDAPHRSFHDDQHKPELVVALSRFEALSGFRRPAQVLPLLTGVPGRLVGHMRDVLTRRPDASGVREAFALALHARFDPGTADDVEVTVQHLRERLAAGADSGADAPRAGAGEGPAPFILAGAGTERAPSGIVGAGRGDVDPRRATREIDRAHATVVALAGQHPGDPGAIVSLMLNRVTLEPGRAMFLPAGVVHAYLSGTALEVMSASDNVLRAGLTNKHVDVDALLECAGYEPAPPVRPRYLSVAGRIGAYRPPIAEFALELGRSGTAPAPLYGSGPRILLCLDGAVQVMAGGGAWAARRGESVFVPDATGPIEVSGPGVIAAVHVP